MNDSKHYISRQAKDEIIKWTNNRIDIAGACFFAPQSFRDFLNSLVSEDEEHGLSRIEVAYCDCRNCVAMRKEIAKRMIEKFYKRYDNIASVSRNDVRLFWFDDCLDKEGNKDVKFIPAEANKLGADIYFSCPDKED